MEGFKRLSQQQLKIVSSSLSEDQLTYRDPLNQALRLFDIMIERGVQPDSYTLNSLMGCQRTTNDLVELWNVATALGPSVRKNENVLRSQSSTKIPTSQLPSSTYSWKSISPSTILYNSYISSMGRLGSPNHAVSAFDDMERNGVKKNRNTWHSLLKALGSYQQFNNAKILISSKAIEGVQHKPPRRRISELVEGCTGAQAALRVLQFMKQNNSEKAYNDSKFNSQSYCLVISALANEDKRDNLDLALDLFRLFVKEQKRWQQQQRQEARQQKPKPFHVDGRLLNAVLRCYGADIEGAILLWKNEIGKYGSLRNSRDAFVAGMDGILFVAGRAGRADFALRICKTMKKGGVEPTEMELSCYNTGKRKRETLLSNDYFDKGISNTIKDMLNDQYEKLLILECSQFDKDDVRRQNDLKIRIII